MRPGSAWTTRGRAGVSRSSGEAAKPYAFEALGELPPPLDDEPLPLEPEPRPLEPELRPLADVLRRARVCPLRAEPDRPLRLDDERLLPVEAELVLRVERAPFELRVWRVRPALPLEAPVAAAPALAPRTAPRAAATATSPALRTPANP